MAAKVRYWCSINETCTDRARGGCVHDSEGPGVRVCDPLFRDREPGADAPTAVQITEFEYQTRRVLNETRNG
jgi:hypothetical protein